MRLLYYIDILKARQIGVDISSDYTKIYFESDSITDSDYRKIGKAMSACVGLRQFRGEEDIDYSMTIIDKSTGETTTHLKENYSYSYEKRSIFSLLDEIA